MSFDGTEHRKVGEPPELTPGGSTGPPTDHHLAISRIFGDSGIWVLENFFEPAPTEP